MGDAILSNAEEKIIVKNSSVSADERREAALIPTAIVKPKYQKLAFDERQLPIHGANDMDSWVSSNDDSSATITTTPRKVQKHLPKTQKTFSKQSRRLMNSKSGEICSTEYDVTDKMAINPNCRRGECDIECNDDNFHQQPHNSVAIVQPIKKIETSDGDEKICIIEKEIDYSINSERELLKAEPKNKNSVENKISLNNESKVARMSDCGVDDKNFNRKCAEKSRENKNEDKKMPTTASKKLQKIHSGNLI